MNPLWLILIVPCSASAGGFLMALFAAGAQSDARLDRTKDDASRVTEGVPVSNHGKGV